MYERPELDAKLQSLVDQASQPEAESAEAEAPPAPKAEAAPTPTPAEPVPQQTWDEFAKQRSEWRAEQERAKAELQAMREENRKFLEAKEEMSYFEMDPLSVLEKMDLSPEQRKSIAQKLLYAEMGDDALPEYKTTNELARIKRENAQLRKAMEEQVNKLREEWQQAEQRKAQEQAYRQTVSSVSAVHKDAEKMANLPHLKIWFEKAYKEPEAAYDDVVGLQNALAEKAKSEGRQPPSFDEVLKMADANAAAYPWVAALASSSAPAASPANPDSSKAPASPTLNRADQTSTTKALSPENLTDEEKRRRLDEYFERKMAEWERSYAHND